MCEMTLILERAVCTKIGYSFIPLHGLAAYKEEVTSVHTTGH